MDFERVWLPYLYLYGVGGTLFAFGLVTAVRTKALRIERKSDRRWLGILIFGLAWYMTLHGVGILFALNSAEVGS